MSCDMILQRENEAEANSTEEAVYSHTTTWGDIIPTKKDFFSFQDTIPRKKEFFFPGYNKMKAKGW